MVSKIKSMFVPYSDLQCLSLNRLGVLLLFIQQRGVIQDCFKSNIFDTGNIHL